MIDDYQEYEQESIQQLPFSREAEQAVIGAILQNNELIHDVPATLTHEAFYDARHRRIYQAIEQLVTGGRKVDIIDLAEILSRSGDDRNGGDLLGYMSDLAMDTPGANVAAYSKIVLSRHLDRAIIAAGIQLSRLGYEPGEPEDKIHQVSQLVSSLDSGEEESAADMNSMMKKAIEVIDNKFRDQIPPGIMTGLVELDNVLEGMQDGELYVIAARPSMGKTALMMNIGEYNIMQGNAVLTFSLEMPKGSLMNRMLSSVGRINSRRVRSGKLLDDEWVRLGAAGAKLKDKKLFIDDSPALTIAKIESIARKYNRKHNLRLILVDYIQIIAGSNKENRTQEVSAISRGLKSLAKRCECPVIALSQLNRGVELRANKRPGNADLRESGQIEQDADGIIFIYRDSFYNPDSPDKGVTELIVGKNREGETKTVYVADRLEYSRFENLDRRYEPPENSKDEFRYE